MAIAKSVAFVLLVAISQSVTAETKRQHGSHEHGSARLDIVVENNEIHIRLDSPAANIIGFEHAPHTAKQKDVLHKALKQLEDGTVLFLTPKTAGCSLHNADVDSPFAEQHASHGHDETVHGKTTHADDHTHSDAHEDKHVHEESHTDIIASWQFGCERADAVNQLTVKLFDHFPNLQRLQVQYISSDKQGGTMLEPSNPALTF